jgi:hypothetical protein
MSMAARKEGEPTEKKGKLDNKEKCATCIHANL